MSKPSKRMRQVRDNASVLEDVILLVWKRKLWWMIPLLLACALLALLIVAGSSPITPFLYPFF